MILKLLLIAAVIWVVYIMFFKNKSLKQNETKTKTKKPQANDMVECASCGVYVEVSEAILSNGKYYCSRECLTKAK
jgi:uncharacterized protein